MEDLCILYLSAETLGQLARCSALLTSYRVEIISLLTHLLSEPELMFASTTSCVCVCGGEIIDKQRKMKDPHWHKSKHDCEEVTYQSLWILFINGEEDQPLWIFTNGEEDQSLCVFIQSPALVSLPPGLINSQRFLNYL